MALYAEGASSLCVNGSVDMLGMRTGLAGTVYQGMIHMRMHPRRVDLTGADLQRNLVMGLTVGAARIALAVFCRG